MAGIGLLVLAAASSWAAAYAWSSRSVASRESDISEELRQLSGVGAVTRPLPHAVEASLSSSRSQHSTFEQQSAPAAQPAPAPSTATPTAPPTQAPIVVDCSNPKPYHVLLTASHSSYQEWQSQLFYYHYQRMRKEDSCGVVGGFTRLLTLPKGRKADSLSGVLHTVVVTELTPGKEDLGFVVLNRPHSVVRALEDGLLTYAEEYVLICETDHLFLKPLPNLATPESAVGYPFHYMAPRRNAKTISIVAHFAGPAASGVQQVPECTNRTAALAVTTAAALGHVSQRAQPPPTQHTGLLAQVGPSPVLMHKAALQKVARDWRDLSFELKRDPAADVRSPPLQGFGSLGS